MSQQKASQFAQKAARRDPGLVPLFAILGVTFSAVGYMLGHKSRTINAERAVLMSGDGKIHPWHEEDGSVAPYKYRYHRSGRANSAVDEHPILSSKAFKLATGTETSGRNDYYENREHPKW